MLFMKQKIGGPIIVFSFIIIINIIWNIIAITITIVIVNTNANY